MHLQILINLLALILIYTFLVLIFYLVFDQQTLQVDKPLQNDLSNISYQKMISSLLLKEVSECPKQETWFIHRIIFFEFIKSNKKKSNKPVHWSSKFQYLQKFIKHENELVLGLFSWSNVWNIDANILKSKIFVLKVNAIYSWFLSFSLVIKKVFCHKCELFGSKSLLEFFRIF